MTFLTAITSLGVALGVGLLVGMEREQSQSDRDDEDRRFGGFRTFPLLALCGAVAGLLVPSLGWGIAAVMATTLGLVFAALVSIEVHLGSGRGITTEIAGLAVFLLGLLAAVPIEGVADSYRWGLVAAVATAVMGLLTYRRPLRRFAERIRGRQLRLVVQVGVLLFVVLPLLRSCG